MDAFTGSWIYKKQLRISMDRWLESRADAATGSWVDKQQLKVALIVTRLDKQQQKSRIEMWLVRQATAGK